VTKISTPIVARVASSSRPIRLSVLTSTCFTNPCCPSAARCGRRMISNSVGLVAKANSATAINVSSIGR